MSKDDTIIVGIDEAGRGALAGPVVAGACVLSDEIDIHPLVRDSKQLSPEQRSKAYTWIIENCIWGIGSSTAEYIDAHGILAATESAMQEALAGIESTVTPTYLLVDGRDHFWFPYPKSSVIKGDEKEPCISAASILAKVTRDRLMQEADDLNNYGFAQHKGYGTDVHMQAIQQYGPSSFHRKSFIHLEE